jgi:hypothetical protein
MSQESTRRAAVTRRRCECAFDPPTGTAAKLVEHFHMQRVPQEGPWFSLSCSSSEREVNGFSLLDSSRRVRRDPQRHAWLSRCSAKRHSL